MPISPVVPRSITLFAQLLVTFVALVAATAAGLTMVAYRTSLENLRNAARTSTEVAVDTRSQLVTQLLDLRQHRARGFLAGAESVCGEPAGRRIGWSEDCVKAMLRGFQGTEAAAGAILTYAGRRLSASGRSVSASAPDGAWLTVADTSGRTSYVTSAAHGDARLTLEYDDDAIAQIFRDPAGLGTSGEVFLVDVAGRPITPLRHASGDRADAAVACVPGTGAGEQRDYRGVRVLRASRRIPALSGACVVAHYPYDEALAPAASMGRELMLSGLSFVAAGVFLSFVAARHIAAPVRKLAASAKALQAGDFGHHVPRDGPSEVRDLGRAFAAMSNDLAALVAGEQSARREAEAANRSKDQFLAMLSHELRTPLTAILGWTHTVRAAAHDPVRVERAAAAIERSAEAQRRLIEDLLDVSGIAAGRVRITPAAVELDAIVEGALDAVAPRAEEKGVSIETKQEHSGVVVYADAQRLQQIVWNLVWNAVKFTPSGGVVRVRTRAIGGLAELEVSDTGIGIEPEFLPHVFGWFRRADRDTRNADEGLGLGLALVRQLVELHGGSVRASSEGRGRGSTFVVTLPIFHGDVSPPSGHDDPDTGVANRLASIRVLVVDDDAGSREAVRVLLEQAGAQVDTAASAAEARRQLRATASDVLISDIAMAQESGYTLVETLRSEGVMLPAIALTGYARREDADKAYAAGFDVHLPKPVDPDVLVSVLAAITRRDAEH